MIRVRTENRIGETERSDRDYRRGMQLRHWNKTGTGLIKAQETDERQTATLRLGEETRPFTMVPNPSGP